MSPPPNGPRRRSQEIVPYNGRRRQRRRARTRRRRRIAVLVSIFVLLIAAGAGFGFAGATDLRENCNPSELLRPARIGANTFVYASDGSLLGSIPAERNREPVPLGRISPWMRKATIAIEDRRFYKHGGVDFEGIARALVRDVEAGRVVEGGSTITQQLVRNLYIRKNERTLRRKLTEACLAIRLNRNRSKNWILAEYMNTVYYGNHAYGIEAAAQTYFSRPARKLSLLQAALLAGLPQAPSVFDPFDFPNRAIQRRNRVLRAMYENGDIRYENYREGITAGLKLKRGRIYTRIHEPYFFSYVREELIKEYGAETVRSGGLRVYTTVDRRLQRAGNRAIRDTLYYRDDPASAVVAIDPRNGAIRAMTAVTPGRTGNEFNLAAQARRQAGSTFKTFVLTAAVSEGVNPETTSYTSRFFVYQPDPSSDPWEVSTYSNDYLGSVSIARATLSSDNTVFAQLTLDLGPDKVAAMAHRLGIRSSLKTSEGVHVPTLGLGAMGVSPLEMASAYATLAAGGIYSEPMAIRKVELAEGGEDEDAGWGTPRRRRVISDWVADAVTEILEDNIRSGTGTAASIGRPEAGKTGTTDKHTDAWFCGYTPNLSTTVWVGYPQANIPMESVHGISVAGGTFPAQIWNRFMSTALEGTREWEFPEPRSEPIWHPFTRGQYAGGDVSDSYDSGGGSYYTPPPSTTATTPAKPKPAPPPPPPKPKPQPPPPPIEPPPPPPVEPPPLPPPPP